jgi:site-specific DNA recombinase
MREPLHVSKRSAEGTKKSRQKLRCAVYTRKSTEEGLEQDFNSLDAQREACEAFIASQKHEGWIILPTSYDDGGYSGGTLERPALQRLLSDIRGSKVDVVVVSIGSPARCWILPKSLRCSMLMASLSSR